MAAGRRLFGFSIEDTDLERPGSISPVPESNADGVDYYASGGFGGSYIDIEGVYRTEYDLIRRYREMALYPEVDSAIEDIVNEAIVSDLYESPVQVELSISLILIKGLMRFLEIGILMGDYII